jgi:hypothetical protein
MKTRLIEFSNDVKIEGQPLAAGRYGFFLWLMIPANALLSSQKIQRHGEAFFYKPEEDVLRVKVKPVRLDKTC